MRHFIILLLLTLLPTLLLSNISKSSYFIEKESNISTKIIMDNEDELFSSDPALLVEAISPNTTLWVKETLSNKHLFHASILGTTTRHENGQEIFYRLQNPSLSLLINLDSLIGSETQSYLLAWISGNAFYYGMILLLLFYTIFFSFIFNHKSFRYYLYFHIALIILLLDTDGWLQKIIWLDYPSLSSTTTPIEMVITTSFMILFSRKLLSTKHSLKVLDTILILFNAIIISSLLLFFFMPIEFTMQVILMLSLVITSIIFIAVLYMFVARKTKSQTYYLIAWMSLLIAMVIEYLRYMGYIPSNIVTILLLKIVLFFELLIVSTMTISQRFSYLEAEQKNIKDLARENAHALSQKKFDTKNLQKKHDLLNKLAGTDSLTGLVNRREFFNTSESLIFRSKNNFTPYALMMLDLDHFKNVNDTYGHDIGDVVLKDVTHAINNQTRPDDVFGRIGGEEFAIYMPDITSEEAEAIANKFCKIVRELVIDAGVETITVTMSVGLVTDSNREFTLSELMKSSDVALYEAKKTGRDRVVTVEGLPR